MKVFVTGGTGFIGTHLVRRLRTTPHELHCLVRGTSNVQVLRDAGAHLVRGDVTDKPSLLEGMKGCDWVVNLASLFEFWVPDGRAYQAVNVTGTRNVMEAVLETGASKVVHVSTVAIFGDAPWPMTEASEPGPHCASRYAQSKRAGDRLAWELYRSTKLPLVMIQPGAVVGPDDPKAAGQYLKSLVRAEMPAQVLTDCMFAWVHVRDVAEAIVRALEKEGNIGERYLIVSENLTFGQFNKLVSEISGTPLPRWVMPDSLTMLGAHLLTALSGLTRRAPALGLAVDQMRLMRQGFEADGSKAKRELGIVYIPIRVALQEAIERLKACP